MLDWDEFLNLSLGVEILMENTEDIKQTFVDFDHDEDSLVSMTEVDAFVDEHTVSTTTTDMDYDEYLDLDTADMIKALARDLSGENQILD